MTCFGGDYGLTAELLHAVDGSGGATGGTTQLAGCMIGGMCGVATMTRTGIGLGGNGE